MPIIKSYSTSIAPTYPHFCSRKTSFRENKRPKKVNFLVIRDNKDQYILIMGSKCSIPLKKTKYYHSLCPLISISCYIQNRNAEVIFTEVQEKILRIMNSRGVPPSSPPTRRLSRPPTPTRQFQDSRILGIWELFWGGMEDSTSPSSTKRPQCTLRLDLESSSTIGNWCGNL